MDVRIGSIDATIVDSGANMGDSAQIEQIAKRVYAMIKKRELSEERRKDDVKVSAPDDDDIEDYG
jgi:hypothetical protein